MILLESLLKALCIQSGPSILAGGNLNIASLISTLVIICLTAPYIIALQAPRGVLPYACTDRYLAMQIPGVIFLKLPLL
jgi:hypothetical protein